MSHPSTPPRRLSGRVIGLAALVAALLLAGVVSLWASEDPDGLTRVANDLGLAPQGGAKAGGVFADYRAGFVADDRWAQAVAGVVGVLVVLVLAGGLVLLLRSQRGRGDD